MRVNSRPIITWLSLINNGVVG